MRVPFVAEMAVVPAAAGRGTSPVFSAAWERAELAYLSLKESISTRGRLVLHWPHAVCWAHAKPAKEARAKLKRESVGAMFIDYLANVVLKTELA